MSQSTQESKSLRIAFMGTRGAPALYGGFETAVEEIGARLADRGHEVTMLGADEVAEVGWGRWGYSW